MLPTSRVTSAMGGMASGIGSGVVFSRVVDGSLSQSQTQSEFQSGSHASNSTKEIASHPTLPRFKLDKESIKGFMLLYSEND